MESLRFVLDQSEIPTHWYNVVAHMPNAPTPPLGADGKPAPPDQLAAIFPQAILEQEMSAERWIPIPEKVREIYQLWRPSPLFRAHRLEAALGTPAKIYYKYEGVSPAGSHKVNTSVAQAYYNAEAGIKRIATEPGAGQWGCSMALAGQMQVDAMQVSSRLSTLKPMGSYRVTVQGGDTPTVQLQTLEGSLELSGTGQWVGSRLRFDGVATAQADRIEALSNLLNIIGRRNGARSIIKVGSL